MFFSIRRSVPLALLTGAAVVASSPMAVAAPTAHAASAPKCFGKKPSVVVTKAHTSVTLGAKTKNAVVDLLGKADSLNAGKAKGNTLVCDSGGARSIITGTGNDKVSIKDGSPTVSTGKGNDTFAESGTGNPVVHLGDGNDVGMLGKGNGSLYGDGGNDVLTAGSKGRQKIYGGDGKDVIYAGKATATLDGGAGGTRYLVPSSDSSHTTVVLHGGDLVNGRSPVTPAPAPKPTPTPTPTPVPTPAAPLPVGTIVSFGYDATPNFASPGADVVFDLTGAPGSGRTLTSWSLGFGDGAPVQSGLGAPPLNLQHHYLAAGSPVATLTLTDDLGRAVTTTATISVSGLASAAFTLPATQTAHAVTGTFTGSPGAGAGFDFTSIDYGDGSDAVLTEGAPGAVSHTYAAAGTYTVRIDVENDHGDFETASHTVAVTDTSAHASLVADGIFSGNNDVTEGFIGLDASRSAAPTGQVITKIEVNADATHTAGNGDDVTQDAADYGYDYTTSGVYTATVTVTYGSGLLATTSITVYVATPPGTADTITPTGPSVPAGATATFTTAQAAGTAPGATDTDKLLNRGIDFGDGSDDVTPAVGGTNSFSHIYASPGVYTVSYDVTDSYRHEAYVQATVLVTGAKPLVSLNGQPGTTSPWLGLSAGKNYLRVDAIGSNGHGTGLAYTLDFGDGSAKGTGNVTATASDYGSEGSEVAHTYAQGEYTVTVTVTDAAGLTATAQQHVSVSGQPTLTLGPVTESGGTLRVPVTAASAGASAVGDYYELSVSYGLDDNGNSTGFYDQVFNGLPPSVITAPVADGEGPYGVDVELLNDHNGEVDANNTP